MKIAVYHNLPSGGGKKALYEIIRALHLRGHIIDVFQPSIANSEFYDLRNVANSVHIIKTSTWPILNSLGVFVEERRTSKIIADQINNNSYHGIIVTNSHIVQHPFIMKYITQPFILLSQEYLRLYYERTFNYRMSREIGMPVKLMDKLKNNLYSKLISILDKNNILSGKKKVIVNSFFSQSNFKRSYGISSDVYYPGVSAAYYPLQKSKNVKNMVISVGALIPFKGHDFAIKSLGLLPKSLRPSLSVIGDRSIKSSYPNYLTSLAKKHDVDMDIKMNVSENKLVQYYNDALLTLCCNVLEPFGMVPVESMACGTPVVAIAEGGLRETVINGTTGLLTSRNELEFAHAISKLLTNENLRKKYGESGPAYVAKKFSWIIFADKLENDFRTIT